VKRRSSIGALAATALLVLISAAPASAAEPASPHWTIFSQPAPAEFHPGDPRDVYEVLASNEGAADTAGPLTFTDTLPAGLAVTGVTARAEVHGNNGASSWTAVGCLATSGITVTVTCTTEASVPIGRSLIVGINVSVPGAASGTLRNEATISGGGAPESAATSNSTPLTPISQPVPYGATLAAALTGSDGLPTTQAGSHPFAFNTLLAIDVSRVAPTENCGPQNGNSCMLTDADTKDVEVATPPGLVGNPTVLPQCSQNQFEGGGLGCLPDTQVGTINIFFYGNVIEEELPVYNIVPPPGHPAEFGFRVFGTVNVPLFFHLRSDGDYGLTADLSEINEVTPFRLSRLSIWGNPADERHDSERKGPGCQFGCPSDVENPKPFLTLPTGCAAASLPVSLAADSWENPLSPLPVLDKVSLPGMNGCNQLHFDPTLEARPTTNVADSLSGLHVDIHLPQPEEIEGKAEAHLKDTVVTLPKGLTLNPASAAGLEGCNPAQFGLTSTEGATPIRTTADPATCPDASKLGTAEIDSPLLKDPVFGAVYLAQPYDNPFKSLLAIYTTFNDPISGTVIKLAGQVEVGPDGQLTATVTESPQLPFTDFKLDFFGGARAPLRTPALCGSYETTAELTPWSAPESGPPASKSDAYQISSGPGGHACANTEASQPNAPSFEAGTASPLAGAYSPFSLHLHREDGSQVFKALNVNLPPGLVGKLAGVGECPEAALAAAATRSGAAEQVSPSCPASSRIGTVNVAAGAGPSPFNAGGVAYLAGPYKGAPLSVAVITPAVAGPFDLGTVVVRSALHINPETAQVSVTSDPIPTQLQGIQLDIRSIDVNLDRQQFTLNPTNCERMAVSGQEISSQGNAAALTSPFQVGECRTLGFKPKLALKLAGKTKRTGHPALRAALTYPKGAYANIARAQVTLPHSEFLDQSHIGTVCTRVQFNAGAGCPAASIYGHARAITPLLDNPIEGPVYLRSSNHKLPDLVAALNGQISVDLAGKVDTGKGGGIRNTFEVVPDAPVSKFVLSLKGGNKGLLVNSENICKHPQHAIADFTGQNGKVSDTTPRIANDCGGGKGKK
jgi:hypothetical protein